MIEHHADDFHFIQVNKITRVIAMTVYTEIRNIFYLVIHAFTEFVVFVANKIK